MIGLFNKCCVWVPNAQFDQQTLGSVSKLLCLDTESLVQLTSVWFDKQMHERSKVK